MLHDLVVEGLVVLPNSVEPAQIGISGGLIAEVKKQGLQGSKVIRAEKCLVFPGFIDAHVHMREPGWEQKEDFRSGSLAGIHGGVTTVFDMPNNPTPTTSVAAIRQKRILASKSHIKVELFAGVLGANLGNLLEMAPFVVGFKGYLARSTGGLFLTRNELERALPVIEKAQKPISLHCEDQSVIDTMSREAMTNKAPDAYADLRPPSSEIQAVRDAASSVEKCGHASVNICHVSTNGALEIIDSRRRSGMVIHCEAALHHLFFTRDAMSGNQLLKTNPPLRSDVDRTALLDALRAGRVDLLVTDHAPHTKKEKLSEGSAGVPGLDDYGHIVSWLLRVGQVDPLTIAKVSSFNPSEVYGLNDRGRIAVGKSADLTILDSSTPEVVKSEDLMTKCGWSPYEGIEFPGRVKWTVVSGKVLMDDFEIVA